MKKSRVCALGLVGFLTAVTAFSTLAATSGGGGALLRNLSDNSAHSNTLSQQNFQNDPNAPLKAQNGPLNLSPETDKTIYTTESGIEIKSHDLSASGAETSIQYFTLGAYNGTPVNWLIVGASSNGIAPDTTDAGAAILSAHANGKLVTGATNSVLSTNQLLCISQYAFNQETYAPNFIKADDIVVELTPVAMSGYTKYTCNYQQTTDELTDYYKSYTALPNIVSNSLTLGTTLGINGYYGSESGKIVINSNFSSNYVFSLSAANYTRFVSTTNSKISYLFTNLSTKVTCWLSDSSVTGTITSQGSSYREGSPNTIYPSGAGAANFYVSSTVNNLGEVTNSSDIATFSAPLSKYGNYKSYTNTNGITNRRYPYKTTYSVTNYSISMAYRPAFVMQL